MANDLPMTEVLTTTETIAAISTPPGRGGIGIVRLSGPLATSIAAQLVSLRQPLEHGRARLADVLDASVAVPSIEGSARIDEAVVTFFVAPNSYTTDDLVEIAAHGSPVVLDLLLRRALELGARLAEPGEFTQRAFLSGRLDLTQAEAVRDLIEAQTLTQARQAASQMGGVGFCTVRTLMAVGGMVRWGPEWLKIRFRRPFWMISRCSLNRAGASFSITPNRSNSNC